MNNEKNNDLNNGLSPDAEKLQSQAEALQSMIDLLRTQADALQEQATKLGDNEGTAEAQKKPEFSLSRPEGMPAPETTHHHHRHSSSSSSGSSSGSHHHSSSSSSGSSSGSHHHSSSSSSGSSSSHRHSSGSSSSSSGSHHHSSSSSSSHHHSSSSSSGSSSSHHSSSSSSSHHRSSGSSSSSSGSHHHSSSSSSSDDTEARTDSKAQKKSGKKKHRNSKSKFKRINVFKNLRASIKMQSSSNSKKKIRRRKFKLGSSNRSRRKGIKDPNMPTEKPALNLKPLKVMGAVAAVIAVIALSGFAVYKAFVIPRLVEPALEQAAELMSDDSYISAVTKEIRRLYQAGQVSGKEIEEYLERHDETVADYIPGAVYRGGTRSSSASKKSESPYDPTTGTAGTSNKSTNVSSLGVGSVNVREDDGAGVEGSTYYESLSDGGADEEEVSDTISKAELITLSSDELLERARQIMTADDFAMALKLRSKIDLGRLRSLRDDKDAAIAYIQSCISPDEYIELITIYAKYSNHLTD